MKNERGIRGDIPFADSHGVDGYLVTPSDTKKKYDHSKKETSEPKELKREKYKKYK